MPAPDMKTLQLRLADALKSLREDRALSVYEIAERMGKKRSSAPMIYRWERGESVPVATQLWAFLVAIGASFADLEHKLNPKPASDQRLREIARELDAMAKKPRSPR